MRPAFLKISIRRKLLLASLSLLVVPWLGYQYILGIESYLRSAQEQQLLDRVAVIASVMNEQKELFKLRESSAQPSDMASHIYVRPLRSAIQLDAYGDDWSIYENRRQRLGTANTDSLAADYRIGIWKDYLYLYLEIKDDRVIYRKPNNLRPGRSDHLRISLITPQGEFKRYYLTTISPGWVNAYHMPNNAKNGIPVGSEFRIKGEWQESSSGYNLEIRIPIDMIGDKLSLAVVDVDDASTRKINSFTATASTDHKNKLGTIVIPTSQMESLLQRLQKSQSRIWVVDPAQRVIGLADKLNKPEPEQTKPPEEISWFAETMRIFYRLILRQPANAFHDSLSSVSYLDDPTVTSALTGEAKSNWRKTQDDKVNVLTAAHPIYINDEIVGAIAIEETSNSILMLQNQAIEALVNMSVIAFALTIGGLLTFATRLSIRVRRLRNEVEASITPDGRIQKEINPSNAGDELGDLGRSFCDMHQRLSQYNRYLETMAGKLSHELRTPITIVRSSLDNLEQQQTDEERLKYIQRANEGVTRLSGILTRMSEATHLEQTIQKEEAEFFSVNDVVSACTDGYRLAHPNKTFEVQLEQSDTNIKGSPELIAQLLDKLVSNALDFATANTAIKITVSYTKENAVLSVSNEGLILPEEMRTHLFDSMVSMRKGKSDTPHLGLGLYIVRLIVDYHHGTVRVDNLPSDKGVVFSVTLPLS